MLGTRRTLGARLADAVDLALDFATLGEYGLEPAEERPTSCETRWRPQRSAGELGAVDRAERLAIRR